MECCSRIVEGTESLMVVEKRNEDSSRENEGSRLEVVVKLPSSPGVEVEFVEEVWSVLHRSHPKRPISSTSLLPLPPHPTSCPDRTTLCPSSRSPLAISPPRSTGVPSPGSSHKLAQSLSSHASCHQPRQPVSSPPLPTTTRCPRFPCKGVSQVPS